MERALPLTVSPFAAFARLDPKRIAATSVAIAVHVVLLMLLLMPVSTAPAPAIEEQTMIVVPEVKKLELIRIPLPPRDHPVWRDPAPALVPLQDPPMTPVDDTPSPVDTSVPPTADVAATVFDPPAPAAVIAQIVADIAPVPPYPAQGITRRLAGEVVLRIRVDAGGRPVEVTIERSSGSTLLDEAARKFVKARWHFVPATQDGQAIEAFALLPVNFVLPR